MSNVYIYSTLSCNRIYGSWDKGAADLPIKGPQVHIKGGANVADGHFITPKGVCTTITENDLAICQKDPVFLRHVKRGFIKVEKREEKAEKVASDMESRDASAPLTPGDYEAKGEKAPTTSTSKSQYKK